MSDAKNYAGVVVEAPLTKIFHYRVPPHLLGKVHPGDRAEIPFGKRRVRGVVVSLSDMPPIDPALIKELHAVSPPEERVPRDILDLTRWVADYYRSGWGMVLAAALPAGVKRGSRERTAKRIDILLPADKDSLEYKRLAVRAPKQAACLGALMTWRYLHPASVLANDNPDLGAAVTAAALRQLEEKGFLALSDSREAPAPFPENNVPPTLTGEQAAALAAMERGLAAGTYHSYLLHGITGSGKTEVYIRLIAKALEAGRGALALVPEISLTPQTVSRFRSRFGDIAVLHSNLSDGERARHWRALATGGVKLAVGARSAIFAPVANLGLVIVDEEHEKTYKQDNDPRYHARDAAVMRAHQAGAVVVLGSATPSLESWINAASGKHALLTLAARPGNAEPPRVEVVDLKDEWADVKHPTLFSRRLESALKDSLKRREQAILFLNRRGFHTSVRCGVCGEAVMCDNCDVAMIHHRRANILRCSCCGAERRVPDLCPTCSSRVLKFIGTGTERAESVLAELFPKARLLRMDSDSMSGRDSHRSALESFARGEYDILLGTQMVAKGLDFPNVTLVGVLMADGALGMSDFRAAERTFQLVTQVIGRAGRAGKAGLAVVQAFQPEHPAVTAAVGQDYRAFVDSELPDRKKLAYPPFGRLARLIFSGEKESQVREAAAQAGAATRKTAPGGCRLLGPSVCEVEKLQGVFRHHMLLLARDHRALAAWLDETGIKPGLDKGVRVTVDIDPASML